MIYSSRTAEMVGRNHPDKMSDQISDKVSDLLYDKAEASGIDTSTVRAAIEVLANGSKITVGGEASFPSELMAQIDFQSEIKALYGKLGNDKADEISVDIAIRRQSPEIAAMTDKGAGDQGIMCGYATTETPSMMPLEYELARRVLLKARDLADDGTLSWLRHDTKSQVSVNADNEVTSVILALQHYDVIDLEDLRRVAIESIIAAELGDIDPSICKVNHKGSFITGNMQADAGLTGRKIVVDAYGPRVSVGGGAFSGKDPTKVDRSAAYMARYIARYALSRHPAGGSECSVQLAYGIGQLQPEAVNASLDGRDISDWVKLEFSDLSPQSIQEQLGLWKRQGWRYVDTASFGHFGRVDFPWEAKIC